MHSHSSAPAATDKAVAESKIVEAIRKLTELPEMTVANYKQHKVTMHESLAKLDELVESFLQQFSQNELKKIIKKHPFILHDLSLVPGKDIKGNFLALAVLLDYPRLVGNLVACGLDKKTRTRSAAIPFADDNTILMLALWTCNLPMARIILEHDIDILHATHKGEKKFHLFNITEHALKFGIPPYEKPYDDQQKHELLKLMAQALQSRIANHTLKESPGADPILEYCRHQYFIQQDVTVKHTLDIICACLRQAIADQSRIYPVQLELNTASTTLTHASAYEELYHIPPDRDRDEPRNIQLKIANAKLLTLFSNPERCVPYLRFINDEFVRYCAQYPDDKFAHTELDPTSYYLKSTRGLLVPVARAHYQAAKKNSRLQEFLYSVFREYGLGDEVIKWMGFVPTDVANQHIANGNFTMEHFNGVIPVFHSKIAHAYQTVVMIHAIQRGDITLPDGATIKDLLKSQVGLLPSKDNTLPSIWGKLRDQRIYLKLTLQDPYHINTMLMQNKNGLFSALSRYMIDSFIDQTAKVAEHMLGRKAETADIEHLFDQLAELPPESFIEYLFRQDIADRAKSNSHCRFFTMATDSDNSHALITRVPYPTLPDFIHHRFTGDMARNYEATVTLQTDHMQSVYITGAAASLGAWQAAWLMYYDHERQCWAFNLPAGAVLEPVAFLKGPSQPAEGCQDSYGTRVNIPHRDTWQTSTPTLALALDESRDLFCKYRQMNRDDFDGHLQQRLAALSNSTSRPDIPAILNTTNEDGNTLLHLALHRARIRTIQLLAAYGTNPLLPNSKEETALGLAFKYVNYSVWQMVFPDLRNNIRAMAEDLLSFTTISISETQMREVIAKQVSPRNRDNLRDLRSYKIHPALKPALLALKNKQDANEKMENQSRGLRKM